jgi:5'-3' exoribonuclease 1
MGIPSFYKHLLQTVSGLTDKDRSRPTQVFALDLNCAIYHCARKPSLPQYAAGTPEERVAWENALIREVLGYIQKMSRIVAPTQTVYVAVDGVAPMAKIKQQRARRFKSAVGAAEEARVRAEAAGRPYDAAIAAQQQQNRWDTNAITPGTEFMRRLTAALRDFQVTGVPKTVVSPADEAGEGEQKIMAWLRQQPSAGAEVVTDVAVYGLDADLIVLAMMEHGRSGRHVDLFREETEFGGAVKSDALGDEQFLYLNTAHLAKVLWETWSAKGVALKDFLNDFVGVMNLLGNDFVPHGMSLKIHDEGIETVLEILRGMAAKGRLVNGDMGMYNAFVLAQVLGELGKTEDRAIVKGIRRKLDSRVGASASAAGGSKGNKDPEARALAALNDRPVEWAAERVLAEQKWPEGAEKPRWELRRDWRAAYAKHALWDAEPISVIKAYCQALTWTLRYYQGRPVDVTWYYPWFLPPLFSDVAAAVLANPALMDPQPLTARPVVLKPVEQLAMVLPTTSFHLLPAEYRRLPTKYPHAWPTAWSLFSLGRRFLWECEPLIPLIQPAQIRSWMEECLE